MLWHKHKHSHSPSIDEIMHLQIKRYQLKQRVAKACTDTTDYEYRLKNYCYNNRNNVLLLTSVMGYRAYLIKCGCGIQQAAKETLERFQH
jgi:hypothetical protein